LVWLCVWVCVREREDMFKSVCLRIGCFKKNVEVFLNNNCCWCCCSKKMLKRDKRIWNNWQISSCYDEMKIPHWKTKKTFCHIFHISWEIFRKEKLFCLPTRLEVDGSTWPRAGVLILFCSADLNESKKIPRTPKVLIGTTCGPLNHCKRGIRKLVKHFTFVILADPFDPLYGALIKNWLRTYELETILWQRCDLKNVK